MTDAGVGQAGPAVDLLEDLVELVVRREGDLVHGGPASLLDAAPVEVVADVEDVLGLVGLGPCLHGLGNELLRLLVDFPNVSARRWTRLPVRIVTLGEV